MQDLVQAEVPGGFIAVRHIKHGQKISEPGVYDMPMGWYHDDCCVGPSISSSGLRTIWQKSPLHYWYDSYMNPDRDEEDDEKVEAEALRMGRAAHALLLEPHLFGQMFTTRPPIFADWRTQKARQWRAEQQLEGKTVLDPAEFQRVHLIAKALLDEGIDAETTNARWRDGKVALFGALELGRLLVVHDGARQFRRVLRRQRLV